MQINKIGFAFVDGLEEYPAAADAKPTIHEVVAQSLSLLIDWFRCTNSEGGMYTLIIIVVVSTTALTVHPPPASIEKVEGFADQGSCEAASGKLRTNEQEFKAAYYRVITQCVPAGG